MVIHLHQSIVLPFFLVGPALIKFMVLSLIAMYGSLAIVVVFGKERKTDLITVAASFACTLLVAVLLFAVALLALPEITLLHD